MRWQKESFYSECYSPGKLFMEIAAILSSKQRRRRRNRKTKAMTTDQVSEGIAKVISYVSRILLFILSYFLQVLKTSAQKSPQTTGILLQIVATFFVYKIIMRWIRGVRDLVFTLTKVLIYGWVLALSFYVILRGKNILSDINQLNTLVRYLSKLGLQKYADTVVNHLMDNAHKYWDSGVSLYNERDYGVAQFILSTL